MRDLMNNIDVKRGISPAVVTNLNTPFVSQILDTQGTKSVTFLLLTGALTDPDATFAVLAEESDDPALAGANAVDDRNLLGTEAKATPLFSDDNKAFKLGFIDTKRYVRVTVTPSGNNAGDVNLAGVWVTEPDVVPTANPPA